MGSLRPVGPSRPHEAIKDASAIESAAAPADRLTTASPEIGDDAADRRGRLRHHCSSCQDRLERLLEIALRRLRAGEAEIDEAVVDSSPVDESRRPFPTDIHGRFRRDRRAGQGDQGVSRIAQRGRMEIVLNQVRANHAGGFGRVNENEPEVDAAGRELAAKALDRRREAIGDRTVRAHKDQDRRARGMAGVERIDGFPFERLHIEQLSSGLGGCKERHQREAQHDGDVSAHSRRTLQVRCTEVKRTRPSRIDGADFVRSARNAPSDGRRVPT